METKGSLFITGAAGFVGSRLMPQLRNRHCLVLEHQTHISSQSGCTVCKIDDLDKLPDVTQVLHLGAKIRGNRRDIYKANLNLTERLIKFCESRKAKMIFISTINVRLKLLNLYSQSKLDAENLILQSGIDYHIIRPSYLFDPALEVNLVNLDSIFALMKWFPFVPILPFEAKVQPLAVEELIRLILMLLNHSCTNSIWEIAGPKTRDIQEMIHSYLRFRGMRFKSLTLYPWTGLLIELFAGTTLAKFFQNKIIEGEEKGVIRKLGLIEQPF